MMHIDEGTGFIAYVSAIQTVWIRWRIVGEASDLIWRKVCRLYRNYVKNRACYQQT